MYVRMYVCMYVYTLCLCYEIVVYVCTYVRMYKRAYTKCSVIRVMNNICVIGHLVCTAWPWSTHSPGGGADTEGVLVLHHGIKVLSVVDAGTG